MSRAPSRILVVDDNAALRENIAECLEGEGYGVVVAENGERALAVLAEDPPPAGVVLDLLMPGMGGREIVARIRDDARLTAVRVVLTTGHPSPSARAGIAADAFLAKPFGVKELLAALAHVGVAP
jgi:CheY-like chemotaxis protein